jgi:Raf kinase inhibitor-like YbhB/YbcL family protein
MKITSTEFEDQGNIPPRFTCDGENINPSLDISDVPKEAQSLVLIIDDPDAPAGTFTHWLIWNIPPEADSIPTDGLPEDAVQGLNDSGGIGYFGPCPPNGTHRYFFHLYALDTELDLEAGSGRAELEDSIAEHILEEAILMARYSRP